METKKAGCFLINVQQKSVALVYREKHDDYTFPKGHVEKGESYEQCAIRETAEETRRIAQIIKTQKPYIMHYVNTLNESCVCHMYFAFDIGKSDNTSWDTHPTFFVSIDEVESKLTYENLKIMWGKVKHTIITLLKNN